MFFQEKYRQGKNTNVKSPQIPSLLTFYLDTGKKVSVEIEIDIHTLLILCIKEITNEL